MISIVQKKKKKKTLKSFSSLIKQTLKNLEIETMGEEGFHNGI